VVLFSLIDAQGGKPTPSFLRSPTAKGFGLFQRVLRNFIANPGRTQMVQAPDSLYYKDLRIPGAQETT